MAKSIGSENENKLTQLSLPGAEEGSDIGGVAGGGFVISWMAEIFSARSCCCRREAVGEWRING